MCDCNHEMQLRTPYHKVGANGDLTSEKTDHYLQDRAHFYLIVWDISKDTQYCAYAKPHQINRYGRSAVIA